MNKHKHLIIDTIIGIIFGAFITLILLTSCQPKHNPLKNAEFPCECTYKSTTNHAIKFKCQDGEYFFIDANYNRKINEGEIINEPLQ